jgi:hypothetical protein
MSQQSLIARCTLSEQCLPDAPYRAMLCKLHKDMLDEIDRLKAAQPAQEPVSEDRSRVLFERHWRKTRGPKKSDRELTRHRLQPQTYIQDSANRHWVTWQAALKAAPPAQPAPVHGEATTYAERFTHAVAVLCGAQPPADMVAEWVANIDVNGEHRLQSWVLSQAATPSWAQGIVVLDAAHVLANDPEEGMEHEDRPPVAQPAAHQCHWMQTDDMHTPDTWRGVCGAVWTFTEGGPRDNDQAYCPMCGGVCIEVRDVEKGSAS